MSTALLASAFLTLTWCSVSLGRANPTTHLPGKMPAIRQPRSYMGVGIVGIVCAVVGAVVLVGRPSAAAWLVAAAVIAGGLLPAQVVHNHRVGDRSDGSRDQVGTVRSTTTS